MDAVWQTMFSDAITMMWKWGRWHLKSPASRLFTKLFIQAHIKESIKPPRHWALWGKFTDYQWIPCTKVQKRGKCFHLMTPSCVFLNENVYAFWLKLHWSLFLRVQLTIFQQLVQVMAWCWSGNKPLSVPMMVRLTTHKWITLSQCVKHHQLYFTNPIVNCIVYMTLI